MPAGKSLIALSPLKMTVKIPHAIFQDQNEADNMIDGLIALSGANVTQHSVEVVDGPHEPPRQAIQHTAPAGFQLQCWIQVGADSAASATQKAEAGGIRVEVTVDTLKSPFSCATVAGFLGLATSSMGPVASTFFGLTIQSICMDVAIATT